MITGLLHPHGGSLGVHCHHHGHGLTFRPPFRAATVPLPPFSQIPIHNNCRRRSSSSSPPQPPHRSSPRLIRPCLIQLCYLLPLILPSCPRFCRSKFHHCCPFLPIQAHRFQPHRFQPLQPSINPGFPLLSLPGFPITLSEPSRVPRKLRLTPT